MTHAWALVWPLPALALIVLTEGNVRAEWTLSFFTLTLLWPASLAARRIGGSRAAAALGSTFAVLLSLQALLPDRPPDVQPAVLERRFDTLEEAVRHVIHPEAASGEWRQVQSRSATAEAWVYVLTVLASGVGQPHLTLSLNERPIARLDSSTRLRRETSSQNERHEWHRVQLDQEVVTSGAPLEFVLGPAADASFVPGAVGIVGGFNYRPSSGPNSSALFDGTRWISDPAALLPTLPTGESLATQTSARMRYFIELRLVDLVSRRIIAAFY